MQIPPERRVMQHWNEPREVREELDYDRDALAASVDERVPMLNEGQHLVFDEIYGCVANEQAAMFFVDAPGGTGKTFMLNVLLDVVRARGKIAIAVASSGVAALLLHGGRTAHSRFQIPLENVNESSTCSISAQSGTARLIRMANLIIWDEASMMTKYQIGCVDRLIQDLMTGAGNANANLPFGGKVVVFSGDFRQVLPVVRHGERAKIVERTLKRWRHWPDIRVRHLTDNMRIRRMQGQFAQQADNFSHYLLRIGDGREHTVRKGNIDNFVQLPDGMCVQNVDDLLSAVFPHFNDIQSFAARAILSPRNADVDFINNKVIDRFPGEVQTYTSADSVLDQRAAALYPTEFLNALNLSGIPPHELKLKQNCPVMLMRNLNALGGLCNGTRMICRGFRPHVIEAEIISGSHIGQRVFLPRISLTTTDTDLPFQLRRRQFPIRVCFAMTINKSQR
jgi:ATP-dependent DNA helicase PIF1